MVQGSQDAPVTTDIPEDKDIIKHDGGPEFAQVFVIVWLGAAVVTLNTKLLGGTM